MKEEIKPLEVLFLWRLAVAGGGDWLKEIKPDPQAPARRRLQADGLIEQEKRKSPSGRGNALYVSLRDRGWAWLANHLDADLKTRTPAGTEILRRLLSRLKTFLDQEQMSLSDLFIPAATAAHTIAGATAEPARTSDLVDRLRKAYLSLSKGQTNVRVRIAELRHVVTSVPREVFDQALLDLAATGKAVLYPLDNPAEIRPEDVAGAVRTPAGEERHIVYLGGRGS